MILLPGTARPDDSVGQARPDEHPFGRGCSLLGFS